MEKKLWSQISKRKRGRGKEGEERRGKERWWGEWKDWEFPVLVHKAEERTLMQEAKSERSSCMKELLQGAVWFLITIRTDEFNEGENQSRSAKVNLKPDWLNHLTQPAHDPADGAAKNKSLCSEISVTDGGFLEETPLLRVDEIISIHGLSCSLFKARIGRNNGALWKPAVKSKAGSFSKLPYFLWINNSPAEEMDAALKKPSFNSCMVKQCHIATPPMC